MYRDTLQLCTEREFYRFNINKLGLSFKLAPALRPCVFPGKKSKIYSKPGQNIVKLVTSKTSKTK